MNGYKAQFACVLAERPSTNGTNHNSDPQNSARLQGQDETLAATVQSVAALQISSEKRFSDGSMKFDSASAGEPSDNDYCTSAQSTISAGDMEKTALARLGREVDLVQKHAEGDRLRRPCLGSSGKTASAKARLEQHHENDSSFLDWKVPEVR
jgi:hypothetical protein